MHLKQYFQNSFYFALLLNLPWDLNFLAYSNCWSFDFKLRRLVSIDLRMLSVFPSVERSLGPRRPRAHCTGHPQRLRGKAGRRGEADKPDDKHRSGIQAPQPGNVSQFGSAAD